MDNKHKNSVKANILHTYLEEDEYDDFNHEEDIAALPDFNSEGKPLFDANGNMEMPPAGAGKTELVRPIYNLQDRIPIVFETAAPNTGPTDRPPA